MTDDEADNMILYFILDTEQKAVKIGLSTNPLKRLKALQTGNPNKLVLMGVVSAGRSYEGYLHRRFSGYRLNGEWFELSDVIRREVEHLRDDAFTNLLWEIERDTGLRGYVLIECPHCGYVAKDTVKT